MSALPTPPSPDEMPVALRDILFGILIGAAAWLVRYLCSTEKHSLGYIFRRTATAGLTSLLVGLATKGYFSSEGMAFAAAGCAGYASPELVDLLMAKIKAMKGKTPTKGD
jgi:hypothetical protein